MRVALVHDWLTGIRGGERVLEALLELFEDVEIFTLMHVPGSVSAAIEARPIHTSFVADLPFARTRYRHYLPFFPRAIERFDLSGFDLVVSSSHCVAKGVRTAPDVPHLCYCHTPMRYVWDLYESYFGPGRASPLVRIGMRCAVTRLRRWDVATADRPTALVANSFHVRDRIRRHWARDADVVYPPVDVARFRPAAVRDDFHLIVSALVPYKRLDIAVDAFSRNGRRLLVVGDGPEYRRLARSRGDTVEFTGWIPDDEVADLMSRCRAFLMPGEEDFGITAVEAQAAGAPVIALARGGALETVVDIDGDGSDSGGATGVLFEEQTVDSLLRAVRTSERHAFDPTALRRNACRFALERFQSEMHERVNALMGT